MKTVFDKSTREELITRISSLNENSARQWGKMNVYQMLKHCVLCEELYLGKSTHKRAFIGRIFGKLALKGMLKDETPIKRNEPTSDAFKVNEINGDVEIEKKKWIALMKEYGDFSSPFYLHWFFGKMTKEQLGYFVYKHSDHHLRQFNC
jgi:hypothetical protein